MKEKIHSVISMQFGVQPHMLFLTHPTFFSRLTPQDDTDYWDVNINKETYKPFHYTAIIHLSTFDEDFTGGRFVFVYLKRNVTIEPKFARVAAFTSGTENVHRIERVTKGAQFSLFISFTCDPEHAISDPTLIKSAANCKP